MGYTKKISNNFKQEYNKRKENLIKELQKHELNKLTNKNKSNYGKRIRNLLPSDYKGNDSLKQKINELRNFY